MFVVVVCVATVLAIVSVVHQLSHFQAAQSGAAEESESVVHYHIVCLCLCTRYIQCLKLGKGGRGGE